MNLAVLALGSSMGNRHRSLARACALIDATPLTRRIKTSRIAWTPPVGGVAVGPFWNATLLIETSLLPEQLLKRCKTIERLCGRNPTRRFADRTLDVDILLYDQQIVDSPTLQIPHPRLHERDFFLDLLQEVLPHADNPLTQTPWPIAQRHWPRIASLPQ